jgi:NADH-quinone oxidoreductase subunit A
MNQLVTDYLPVLIFAAAGGIITVVLMVIPFLIAPKKPDSEKLSAYECGFNAFDDARMKFDVRFYLIAILFIVFDLEAAYLFPWAVSFKENGTIGYWTMMIFIAELVIGYIYAWRKGALEWD